MSITDKEKARVMAELLRDYLRSHCSQHEIKGNSPFALKMKDIYRSYRALCYKAEMVPQTVWTGSSRGRMKRTRPK
jgi:hypothetical protein